MAASTLGRVSRGRLLLTAALLAYGVIFLVAYRASIPQRYEYFGLGDRDLPVWGLAALVVAATFPSFLVPPALVRPSQLLYWAMYLMVYVPSLFVLFFSNLPRLETGVAVATAAALCAGLCMMGASYHIAPRRIRVVRLRPRLLYGLLFTCAILLYAYMFIGFGSMFRWVTFKQVGGQREAFFDAISGTLGGYAFTWLVAVVNPVLVSAGLYLRRWSLLVAGLVGPILLYGAAGSKGVLLSVLMTPALMLLVYRWRAHLGAVMASGLAALVALGPIGDMVGLKVLGALTTFVVLFRTLAVPGLVTAQYAGFFRDHAHTFGSHISGLSSLLHYPYPRTLDYQLGEYYYEQTNAGLNASTWAGDGIAGFGTPGILLASLACGALFWLLDSAAEGLDIRFSVLALAYGVVNFSNVSLFTNLVTGGIALMILVLALWPRDPSGVAKG